jgi:hypothetical protein
VRPAAAPAAALCAALALGAWLAPPAWAAPTGDDAAIATHGAELLHAARGLDGDQLLADEPIWMCGDLEGGPAQFGDWLWHDYRLVGRLKDGSTVRLSQHGWRADREPPRGAPGTALHFARAGEFSSTFGFEDASGRAPLTGGRPGMPEGAWEVRGQGADSGRVLARFRVVEPRGSERSVRDGLARAARLVGESGGGDEAAQAARLYDAILRRYPRTTYLSVIYVGLWRVRAHTRFAADPDRWLEEIFARFHDTCFGTIALDQWVRDMGEARARPTVARLVGLYPDTPLSRAARRYL